MSTTTDHQVTDTRVQGVAQVGDVVHYSDMANPGDFFEVTAVAPMQMPNVGPQGLYWTDGAPDFTLRAVRTGKTTTSDLRQHGWRFAKAA
jgi:hypothetical protein